MATSRNEWKLSAISKEICEKFPRSNFAQISNVPRSREGYITEVFEEVESRVTKKLSQEISGRESRFLGAGALSGLYDFLLDPLIHGHSRTAPETSRNTLRTNQGTNEDYSQSDFNPAVGVSKSQTTKTGRDDANDSLVGFSYTFSGMKTFCAVICNLDVKNRESLGQWRRQLMIWVFCL